MSDTNRVAEIISHEKQADEIQVQADTHRWEAARLISEELATGKTQSKLADEIGKSQGHVSKCSKLWEKFSSENNRPEWSKAYSSVSSRPPKTGENSPPVAVPTSTDPGSSQPNGENSPKTDDEVSHLIDLALGANDWNDALTSFRKAWEMHHHEAKLAA
jgi:hypothetical protein